MTIPEKHEELFDCIEFKRQAQARIYEKIKNMTPQEEIEFFRRAAESGPFADLWKKITQRSGGESAPAANVVRRR